MWLAVHFISRWLPVVGLAVTGLFDAPKRGRVPGVGLTMKYNSR